MQKSIYGIIILSSFILVPFYANAQVYKLFGFTQNVFGGAAKAPPVNKTGHDQPEQAGESRYFIYADTKPGNPVKFNQLWINRKSYSCNAVSVATPVILPSSDPGIFRNDTLIKSYSGSLMKLEYQPTGKISNLNKQLRKLLDQNDVVLVYKIQNRNLYAVLKKMKMLHPLFTAGAQKN